MPDDMDYPHRCQHCNVPIRRADHGSAHVDQSGMTGTYGENRHLHEPLPMEGSIHDPHNSHYLADHLGHDHNETPLDHHTNVLTHVNDHETGAYDAEQNQGWHGMEHEPMGGARRAHEPGYNYNRENDRAALEYADMSDPEESHHGPSPYDSGSGNAPSHRETLFHAHPTGHQIHVIPPGRPGGRHEVRVDSPDGESEYPERFGKDIALDRPDDMPHTMHREIHKAFDHAEEMDKKPSNAPVHDDEVPMPGEGLDDYLKRMRERDNKVHENLPDAPASGGASDLHEYGNEDALHSHLTDTTPHGHGYSNDSMLDSMRRAGGPLRDLHRQEHEADRIHTHPFSLERRTRQTSGPMEEGAGLRSDDGSHYTHDGQQEYFENSWGRGSSGTGHFHRNPAQYQRLNTPQRLLETVIHLRQHHGEEGSLVEHSPDQLAALHETYHGGHVGDLGGGRHNGGAESPMHDWRVRHLGEDHGIQRSHMMSDEALNELHDHVHETGVMETDHEHSDNHPAMHPRDCQMCRAGIADLHNYEPPSGGHHGMKTIAMNAQDDDGHFIQANLTVAFAYEAGLAFLRQARAQMEGSLTKVAHDSGDGETIYHCPFCGSGQVIARSDRTIECDFCHTSFTVQVQPEFSAFPQTIDGAPVDVPGMPGQVQQNDPNAVDGQQPPMDPSQVGDQDPASFAGPPGPANQPPWLKGGAFRTETGAVLDEDSFVKHLALKVSDRDPGVLVQVRAENLA